MTSVAAIAFVAEAIGRAPAIDETGRLVLSRAEFRTITALPHPPVALDVVIERPKPSPPATRADRDRWAGVPHAPAPEHGHERGHDHDHQAASTSPGAPDERTESKGHERGSFPLH